MKGHLQRRGERSWRLKYDIGSDAAGDRQTRYVTLRGTKAEAQKAAAKILASVATGTHVEPSTESVRDFVERWLRDWADDNVSNKTWTRYARLLRKLLCGRVGSLPIQKLSPADLQAVYAAMARDGLAPLTCLHVHRVTSTMLKHAMQWGVVVRNVATGAILRVEQALEQTTRGGLVFREPKTRHGRRTVTLAPSTVAVLRDHRKAQLEQRLFFGLGKASDDALVFASWDGSPYLLTLQWRRAMKAIGLKATLHSLRHTHASTLIAA